MTGWRSVTLGDVITLQRGFDLTKSTATPGPYPVISSGGRSYTTDVRKVEGPGVVTGRKGVLGKVHFSAGPYWPHDTTLWVKDFKGAEPRYIYYLLQVLPLASLDAGASNPTLNRNHAHLLPVDVPSVDIQRAIAHVLGSIDDLIDDNRRRIELLEQMAQAIYREWFVHFRYPGCESATFVESALGPIPSGWSTIPFKDVAVFTNGFAFKPAHWGQSGRPIIKIKELKQGVTAATPRCEPDLIKQKYFVEPGDLLFSWSADLGVYRWSDEPGLLNQHLFKVVPSGELAIGFLYYALQCALPDFESRAQGTTMRHIKRSALSEVLTKVPDRHLVRRFTSITEPMTEQSIALRHSNRRLVHIRDLLIPRLVTGEIDVCVSNLDNVIGAVA